MPKSDILLVSRDESLRRSVLEAVSALPDVQLATVPSAAEAKPWVGGRGLVVLVAHLTEAGDVGAIADLMQAAIASRRRVVTLVVGELGTAEHGLVLIRRGAADFLERPLNLRHLTSLLGKLARRGPDRSANEPDEETAALTKVAGAGVNNDFLYCPSAEMGLVMAQVRQVAPLDTNVLLQGETGTGKTRLAAVIHDLSPRKGRPFRVVNCAALSASVIESELFGHVKGAYTGADRDRVGKFAEVGDGTLVLDEIDSLPLEIQAKLLRVLEERVFEPVGSNRQQEMKARVVAASNRDLGQHAAQGKFRADLYYRLNVVTFRLPHLRERSAALLSALIDRFTKDFAGRAGRDIQGVTPTALAAMRAYGWPGNVRELRNVIERAVALRSAGPIGLDDLPEPIRSCGESGVTPQNEAGPAAAPVERATRANSVSAPAAPETLAQAKNAAEALRIGDALRRHKNNKLRAAVELGVSRMTLYKKLHQYGMMNSPR